jgi:hypothetical protein
MTEEKKVTREELELPWFLQDPTDAYTNIIRPVDHPGKILFTTTQNPLREVRQRAEFVVRACNSHYDLLEALKNSVTEMKDLLSEIKQLKPGSYRADTTIINAESIITKAEQL